MARWLWQLVISIDQFLNVMLRVGSPDAWADETFSSCCWRNRATNPYKWLHVVIDIILSPMTRTHCYTSYMSEGLRTQSPNDFRVI